MSRLQKITISALRFVIMPEIFVGTYGPTVTLNNTIMSIISNHQNSILQKKKKFVCHKICK